MTKEKGVLGRGLASILGSSNTNLIKNPNQEKEIESSAITGITHEILICQIVPNPFQPRIKFDQEKLNELLIKRFNSTEYSQYNRLLNVYTKWI